MTNVAIVYYSATGNVHALAVAAAEGAEKAGADVRLRKVAELAPAKAIAANPAWAAHTERTAHVPEATVDDLLWADAVLLGTPTRYGAMASQLKQFIDITGPVWRKGLLADKVYGAFGSAGTAHGGHESTLLSLHNIFYHWGGDRPTWLHRRHTAPARQPLRRLPRRRQRGAGRDRAGRRPLPGPPPHPDRDHAHSRPRRLNRRPQHGGRVRGREDMGPPWRETSPGRARSR
ncbi:NAD(P)H-dependent oxidoreductase [Spirillospora sp. NPDC048819]|uniref:NAD(P)H-dependent oxidoreductase n=1 Tax=Spirillospora sp. NPDC048819 TaxID=3155268 RepID=UPI0033E7D6E3